jgi:hypothetical protein
MAIKYFNIFQSKALKFFFPNWGFGFENKPSGNPDPGRLRCCQNAAAYAYFTPFID